MATVGGIPILEQDPDIKVEWVSWEGRPPGRPFAGYSEERKRENYEKFHKPLAEKYGVPIRVAGNDYRTTNAHIATYYARDMGKFKEFRDRVYKARWVDDLNLESPDVLAQLGEEVGLDGGEIKQVIAEKRYLAALHSQRAQGKSQGIRGIPSFVVEGKVFWGTDVIDDVKAEVARVKRERVKQQGNNG
ncbi:MAG: DsbA family protein [Nitrospinota bacterium]